MTYGYISATTGSNDHHTEHFGILSFASNNRLGDVHHCHEAANLSPGKKPVLSGMIANLLPGDTLIAMDLRKLGSSTVEVLEVLSALSRKGVKVYIVTSGIRIEDNGHAMIVREATSLVSQIELELQNCHASTPTPVPTQHGNDDLGHANVIQKPVKRTRKSKLDRHLNQIQSMLDEGHSLSEISRILGVSSRQSLSAFARSRNLSVPGQGLSS